METGRTRPPCPRPTGSPRWVALFYRPETASWQVAAQAPDRSPVLYALGEMTQTLRARGEEATVALWGPEEEDWHRYDVSAPEPTPTARQAAPAPTPTARQAAPAPTPTAPQAVPAPASTAPQETSAAAREPSGLVERMRDRRHQALLAGLSKAGLYDLAPDDVAAVQTVVDRLDEATVRTLAHWLATAAAR
ncbi:hypothetical protein [Streptomyces sp. ALI-76-A]|uniref:hypothetical protein n=1 Tax=Streptomyces sp. ALI-76-A TaxID=3025736 RepID=UPI00256F22DC|nr:hypothetical protein [Streptomyces sp. ALI-76-A]MDL5202871.1 hypothetical protein [Streptomyces sp. ALI-76-A]